MVKQGYKQTEIGVIPEDWEVYTVRDLITLLTDYDANGSFSSVAENVKSYNYPEYAWYVRSTDLENKTDLSNVKYVDKPSYDFLKKTSLFGGELLFLKRGDIGNVYLFEMKTNRATLAPNLYLLKLNDISSSKYLYQYFISENGQKQLKSKNAGSTLGALYKDDVKAMLVPLPPLAEQEAIAAALSDADAWVESLEQLIAKKRLIKQGAMQTLLTPKDDWEVKKLGEVASYRRGSFPQPYGLDKWYDDTNGMPFIQVFDVAKNRKLKIDTKRKVSELAQPMSVFVPKGTIVLTIQGSIGRIALTQYDAYCDRTLLIFEKIDSSLYKFYFLLAVEQIFEIEKEKAPGGTIKTITKEALSDFKITYPKSLSEQERIARILSDMDAELEALEQQLAKARQIKQGMMQELLTGRTRLV
ncbi:restriction endonuclease subunit S [Moheibacter lacus]|nr:restriction endonuclease subunit S [Moheibacter lacus]